MLEYFINPDSLKKHSNNYVEAQMLDPLEDRLNKIRDS
jgi:hypothetical protein